MNNPNAMNNPNVASESEAGPDMRVLRDDEVDAVAAGGGMQMANADYSRGIIAVLIG